MNFKRAIALILVVSTVLSMTCMDALAISVGNGETVYVSFCYYARQGGNGYQKGGMWTQAYNSIAEASADSSTIKDDRGNAMSVIFLCKSGSNSNPLVDESGAYAWQPIFAYCIDHYQHSSNRDAHIANANQNASYKWGTYGIENKRGMSLALLYGFPNNTLGASQADAYCATQIVIWEFMMGCRTITGSEKAGYVMNQQYINCSGVSRNNLANNLTGGALSAYNNLINMIYRYTLQPSFASSKIKLAWDGSKYSATVTDTNNVLQNYDVTAYSDSVFTTKANNVTASTSGNKLTVSSADSNLKTVYLSFSKKLCNNVYSDLGQSFMVLEDQVTSNGVPNQTKVIGAPADPITANVTVELDVGNLEIQKSSEDGIKSGLEFTITGNNGQTYKKTTDANGKINLNNLLSGTYTITETTPDKYVAQASKTVTVAAGKTSYVEFSNVLKKFTVTVTKTDVETTTAQGDGTLAGAKYGIYKDEKLIDTYETDASGKLTSKEYACGSGWTIKEITPSKGYLLDTTVYDVGALEKNYAIEHNSISRGVVEAPITGSISIIKHSDNGRTQIETPEVGAEFEVYLKSAGSFANAKSSERDKLICDENGYAETQRLPYGTYTVKQTKGKDGTELMKPFDVFVGKNNQVYRFLINNNMFESYVKIVKTDIETGKVVPVAGTAFNIYRPDGTKVIQTYTYPAVTTIDTFYTNEDGYLITPEKLPYGAGYSIVEVAAPEGYVLNSNPTYFDITQENTTEESAVTVVEVKNMDMAQKGIIKISKSGEVYASAKEVDDMFQPIYEIQGLSGATYEVYAAEDIYTADGTLRASKDQVVARVTTDDTGYAQTEALYLGKYIVKEIEAPFGMVLSDSVNEVELAYEGQLVTITEAQTSFVNQRQKVEISVLKNLKVDIRYGIGMKLEYVDVLFGLFANEDITAKDGTCIPSGGLVDVLAIDENGYAYSSVDLPFGKYYVQELETNDHYKLDTTKYDIAFSYVGQDTKTVFLTANDFEYISNELIYGSVLGKKVDDEGKPLVGATFGIFDPEEDEYTSDTAIDIVTSDSSGKFEFNKVPYGTWIVRELEAPEGYVLDSKSYEVNIANDAQAISIEATNRPIIGLLEITKSDVSTGELLPNAGYRIKNAATGEIVAEGYTDENGYAKFSLKYGKYTYQEFDAPDGYSVDESEYPFEILNDGQVVKADMTNKRIPKPTPVTEDTSRFFEWLAVSITALGATVLVIKKGKKEYES